MHWSFKPSIRLQAYDVLVYINVCLDNMKVLLRFALVKLWASTQIVQCE